MMEVERAQDGRWHFALGPVERWVVASVVGVLIFVLIAGFHSWALQLQRLTKSYNDLAKQQAVTNAQLATLSQQLADVPAITRQIAQLQVQVNRNTSDIAELRKVRGLK